LFLPVLQKTRQCVNHGFVRFATFRNEGIAARKLLTKLETTYIGRAPKM
jgi:hypothetical protein